jgi:hypothetical protein
MGDTTGITNKRSPHERDQLFKTGGNCLLTGDFIDIKSQYMHALENRFFLTVRAPTSHSLPVVMRKTVCFFRCVLTLGVLLAMLPILSLTVNADQYGDFTFSQSGNTIEITGYTGSGGAVDIPSLIKGMPVTSIGEFAFASTDLTSVTIPDNVTNIGYDALCYCTKLTDITVNALNSDYSSTDGVLFNKNQTTLIQCPGGKTGTYTIPNSVTRLGDDAFLWCTSLAGITIGNSVTNLGNDVFGGCTNLTGIAVNSLNTDYSSADGVLFNKNLTTLVQYPEGKTGSYTIPSSVNTIGIAAFSSCTGMTDVTIPNSVTSIETGAFATCTGLTSITVSDSVISIGASAFSYCTSVTNVAMGNRVTSIEEWTFFSCSSLTCVTMGDSITNIGKQAFVDCINLTNVTMSGSISNLGDSAFENCQDLTMLYFKGNAPNIQNYPFWGETRLTIYYLAGTKGWDTTLGERPTALWTLPSLTAFMTRTNGFGFSIAGSGSVGVVVETCTNLSNPAWVPVATNRLSNGSGKFSDHQWTNDPKRFYRLRVQ